MAKLIVPSFRGDKFYLSNFYPCDVCLDGIIYPSSEHAFVAHKTKSRALRKQISNIETPGKVKRFGRGIPLRPDWEEIKLLVMYRVVLAKFIQNKRIRQKLIQSDDKLVEHNNWNDTFWGKCNGKGSNWLGRILMQVRKDILLNLGDIHGR